MAGRRLTAGSVVQALGIGIGLVAMIGGFALIALQYRPYSVPTDSMEPTISPGETVLAHTVSGGTPGAIGRGDVVVFNDPSWGTSDLVKRVIGIGGDTVKCCDAKGRVTVNGVPLDEPYLDQAAGQAVGQVPQQFSAVVPAGRLWLMGDNRAISADSRVHLDQLGGTVPTSDVVARVEGVAWPFGSIHAIDRTTAFDAVPGQDASRHGPLVAATWATLGGAALVLLTAAAGSFAGMANRFRSRRPGGPGVSGPTGGPRESTSAASAGTP
ncbi:signal peptidase I [Streptacidiphilus sp. MAP5-3]|uniref:signal peptidase I n=1 Tax=unclassified Streptacidiphilus TaxID=2643834 RepID=UPI003511BD5E